MSSESHNEKPDIEPIRPGMDPDRTNAGEESTGLAPPASDLQSHGMIGRSFAHYQILKELGHGGQGYVFLAEDKNLHRQVAVKILHNLQALNPKTRMRFAREAEAASKITHPGICAVHEFGEFEGMPYIAMQYVEGTPLSTRISSIQQSGSETTSFIDFETTQGDNRKPTPSKPESKTSASSSTSQSTPNTRDSIAEVVEMIESIARALHAAHEQNLIHRDIKPANIIISKDGTPVILDFGLARDSDSDAATLTQSGDLMGTPVYMSPEQIAGHRIRMDRRTDVYSLGVTLYECLTLHRPFEAATRERLFQAILTKEATDPSKLNRAISTDLRVIIQTAMAKDPDRRYQTAEGLADDLKAVQEYRPIAAKPVSIFGRAARWSKRHPARACLILALVIGLPLITGLLGYIRANQPQLEKQALIERDARVEKHLEKGFYELHHGSSKKAIEAFELALDQDGDSVEASFGYAIALIEQNRPQDAVKELNRIASITPDPTILNPVRMDALYVLGKKSEADALRKVETHLDSTIAWFIAGTRALQRGEQLSELSPKRMKAFEFAQECLIRANQTSPRRRRAFLFQLAHAVGHTGNMKIGRPVSDSIAHLWPNSAMASFWSAFALGQGDRPREKVLYANAISLAPDWAMLRKNYALCLGSLGELDEGIHQYREAGRLSPAMTGINYDVGTLLMQQRKFDEAIVEFEKAIELDDTRFRSYSNLGRCHLLLKQPEKAEETFREALALDPGCPYALIDMGTMYFARKDYPKAISCFQRALERNPTLESAWTNLGSALSNTGNLESAVEAFKQALALNSMSASTYVNLANTYNRLERRPEGNAAFRKALELQPRNSLFHRRIAYNYMKMELPKEGMKAYQRALEVDPNDFYALDYIAWHSINPKGFKSLRDTKKGIEYASQAVKLTKRQNPRLLETLATAYYENQDLAEAIRIQTEAIELCRPTSSLAKDKESLEKTLRRYQAELNK